MTITLTIADIGGITFLGILLFISGWYGGVITYRDIAKVANKDKGPKA